MKALLCIDNLGSGGAQRQIVSLAVGLKNKGYHVDVFVYYPQDFFKAVLTDNNINVFSIKKNDRLGLNVINKLRKLLKNGAYDFAISYLPTPNIYLAIAAKLAPTSRVKIITSERSKTVITDSLQNKLRYWSHMQASVVIFNSVHERLNWITKFKRLEEKSVTIYNGVDIEVFRPSENQHLRNRTIIGIGTIGPNKNILTLIEALKTLKLDGFFCEVHWYGKHVDNVAIYNDYYVKLFKFIEEEGLIDSWIWCKPEKKINNIISQYDCMVLPSVIEGLPNVVCEALACGLPIIISDVLDHARLVADNQRGYLFDPTDSGQLAEKIKQVMSISQFDYDQMRHNCRKYAEEKLSMDFFIDNYVNLLEGLKYENCQK